MTRSFNWVAFGALVVMRRANGDYYVVDGQQRLAAVKRRGDIAEVPCIVFQSDGREHEARAFLALNIQRRPVTSIDKFHAATRAGFEPESTIARYLSSRGVKVSPNKTNPECLRWPDLMVKNWRVDTDIAKRAFELQLAIRAEGDLSNWIQKGFFYLMCGGIELENEIAKMRAVGGSAAIRQAIREVQIESGMTDATEKICAQGVIRLLNKGRTKKLRMPNSDN